MCNVYPLDNWREALITVDVKRQIYNFKLILRLMLSNFIWSPQKTLSFKVQHNQRNSKID